MTEIPTLIIDPSALFCEGLSRLLSDAGFQPLWCSSAPPPKLLPSLPEHSEPLVILGAGGEEAIDHASAVLQLYPLARVVLLSDTVSPKQFEAALRHGATTIVLKRSSYESLIATLQLVMNGSVVMPTELIKKLLWPAPPTDAQIVAKPIVPAAPSSPPESALKAFCLSGREFSVLQKVSLGLPNKEIARALGISEATVKVHVKAVLRKLKVRNRTQVAVWTSRNGLMDVSVVAREAAHESLRESIQ